MFLVGAIYEGGCHWTFVGIDMANRQITYIDPFGSEHGAKHQAVRDNWERFCRNWNSSDKKGHVRQDLPTDYTVVTPPHTKQAKGDGRTCGIYVCIVRLDNVCRLTAGSAVFITLTLFPKNVRKVNCFSSFSVCTQLDFCHSNANSTYGLRSNKN